MMKKQYLLIGSVGAAAVIAGCALAIYFAGRSDGETGSESSAIEQDAKGNPITGSVGQGGSTEEGLEQTIPDLPADFTLSDIYCISDIILDDELFTMDQAGDDLGLNTSLLTKGYEFHKDGTGVAVDDGVYQMGYQAMEGPKGQYVIVMVNGTEKALELESDNKLYLKLSEDEVKALGISPDSSVTLVLSVSDALPEDPVSVIGDIPVPEDIETDAEGHASHVGDSGVSGDDVDDLIIVE